MKPCTKLITSRQDLREACEQCGHVAMAHRGTSNPDLDGCVICEMQLVMPPRHGPRDVPSIPGVLPTLTVYLVIGRAGLVDISLSLERAHAKGRDVQGLVVELCAAADYRPRTPPAWAGSVTWSRPET